MASNLGCYRARYGESGKRSGGRKSSLRHAQRSKRRLQLARDRLDLRRCELGEHREREGFVGETFGDRERAGAQAEARVSGLQVNRLRVMDTAADAACAHLAE